MDLNNRIKIAKRFADYINSEYIKKIILFGSVARNEDKFESDIDILILSSYGDIIEQSVAIESYNIIKEYGEIISAHIMSEDSYNESINHSFIKNINKEGIILGWNYRLY